MWPWQLLTASLATLSYFPATGNCFPSSHSSFCDLCFPPANTTQVLEPSRSIVHHQSLRSFTCLATSNAS